GAVARSLERGHWPFQTTRLRYAARTDVGVKPQRNEDAFAVLEQANLFVVADGMGGYAGGEVASEIAAHALVTHFRARPNDILWPYRADSEPSEIEDRLVCGIEDANRLVHVRAHVDQALPGMCSTIVAALIADGYVYIANVGDSRAYRLRWGELTRLTRDDSLLEELTAAGLLTLDQRGRCPRNILTRAIGAGETVDVAVSRSEL